MSTFFYEKRKKKKLFSMKKKKKKKDRMLSTANFAWRFKEVHLFLWSNILGPSVFESKHISLIILMTLGTSIFES